MGIKGRGKQQRKGADAAAAREEGKRRHDDEAAALREEAVAVLRLDREGRHAEAIARAEELAATHPQSALAQHLAAGLHHNASTRAAVERTDGQGSVAHLARARVFYDQARRLAPNCVQITVGSAMARLPTAEDHDLEPDREIMRAVRIAAASPTDPAENNATFHLDGSARTATERIAMARQSAAAHYRRIMSHMNTKVIPRAVVSTLEVSKREGAATAKKRARALAERYEYSARAIMAHAHISLDFARGLDPNIDKRPFLTRILDDVNKAVVQRLTSLEIVRFRAKLLFVLGFNCAVESECQRAISIENPVDPGEEDVPPGSVPGEKLQDRISYVCRDLQRLRQKLVLKARDHWCSLPSEKQDSFRFVGLKSMHQYYVSEDDHEAVKTVSDALNFVKKNGSWRFWVCPYCVGKKIPDIDSLLHHMRNKHSDGGFWPKLLSIVDPKLVPDTDASQGDYFLKNATICHDSEENYAFHFKRMDMIFGYLFLRACTKTDQNSLSEIRDEKCSKGVSILEKIKLKLKNIPTDTSSTESNEACAEIRDLWHYFLEISLLDYRVVISPLALSFISEKLLKCMSKDEMASSKSIDVAVIDAIFPFVDGFPNIDAILPNVKDAPDSNDDDTSKAGTHGQSAEGRATTTY
uniref:DUF629 domain-containing protein n=1 Tax=Leersia perrieri TaxID=77586 RepID=A0A0D9WPZ5_9ORYZ